MFWCNFQFLKREPVQISSPLDFRHKITVKQLNDDMQDRKPPGSPAIQRYKAIARMFEFQSILHFLFVVWLHVFRTTVGINIAFMATLQLAIATRAKCPAICFTTEYHRSRCIKICNNVNFIAASNTFIANIFPSIFLISILNQLMHFVCFSYTRTAMLLT